MVDDLCEDRTLAEAERARSSGIPVKIPRNDFRMGLGASIGRGLAESQSDIVAVMDADFTHTPSDLFEMVMLLPRYDFVSGSRFGVTGNPSGIPGHFYSRFYQKLLWPLLRLPLRDVLGGFWVTRRSTLETVATNLVFRGYGDYYSRLLSELAQRSIKIHEFPATYRTRKSGHSKSKPRNVFNLPWLGRALANRQSPSAPAATLKFTIGS